MKATLVNHTEIWFSCDCMRFTSQLKLTTSHLSVYINTQWWTDMNFTAQSEHNKYSQYKLTAAISLVWPVGGNSWSVSKGSSRRDKLKCFVASCFLDLSAVVFWLFFSLLLCTFFLIFNGTKWGSVLWFKHTHAIMHKVFSSAVWISVECYFLMHQRSVRPVMSSWFKLSAHILKTCKCDHFYLPKNKGTDNK